MPFCILVLLKSSAHDFNIRLHAWAPSYNFGLFEVLRSQLRTVMLCELFVSSRWRGQPWLIGTLSISSTVCHIQVTPTASCLQLRSAIAELGEEALAARRDAAATAHADAAQAESAAATAVEAAVRELAGAEAGDGRDESNRSLQERLADAQTAQVRTALRRPSKCLLRPGCL